jgi:hypothetical protein
MSGYLFLALITLSLPAADSSKPSVEEAARKVLESRCLSCHGEKGMSGLDMRQRETLLKGGQRGPAVIPGKSVESLVYEAAAQVGELKMPPGQKPIPAEELEILRQWIDQGLPWTSANTDPPRAEPLWWSFRRPQRPSVPRVQQAGESSDPIDAFILTKLDEKGLTPAPRADKQSLIRRAYFDLVGLPPSPARVEKFVNDPSPKAYENLIDELLASPQYGERWGRHWLDVVRYADTGGYETDIYYRNAWRYRDYVVRAFNQDRRYDRFLQEQIAGDEIFPDDLNLDKSYKISPQKLEHLEARIATGFYTLGPEIHESNMDAKKLLNEKLTDWTDTTGAVFMGLTLGCARCHNHKFDPISQKDYYRFQAIFAGSKETDYPVVMAMSVADQKQHYPRVIAVEEARVAYRLFEKRIKDRIIQPRKKEFPPEVVAAFEVPEDQRTMEQKEQAAPLVEIYASIKMDEALTPEEKQEQRVLYERIAKALLEIPERDAQGTRFDGILDLPVASGLGHREPELVPSIDVLARGDLGAEQEKVNPGLPTVFGAAVQMDEYTPHSALPRNRKKLALWLSQPDHPLTARVMVNRIWQWHFGRGIVSTPNDFGRQGQAPTHPELLDWLATEFMARGWSIKAMHRLIMLSQTYQRSSLDADAKNLKLDPENRYLWRMNRQRLEAEVLWDTMHAVSGTLNLKMGGRPVTPSLAEDEMNALGSLWQWPVSADPTEHDRRGLYILVRRNYPYPMFQVFDGPENAVSCPERDVTTVAPQALWFLNNRVSYQQAQEFAGRLVRETGENPSDWVEQAWRLALGRSPSEMEKREALEMIEKLSGKGIRSEEPQGLPPALARIGIVRGAALTKLCLSVFNLTEFAYVD